MGEPSSEWMPDVAHAAELVARAAKPGARRRRGAWDVGAALDAAVEIAVAADEDIARRDLVELRRRLDVDRHAAGAPPLTAAAGSAWQVRRLADPAPPGPTRLLPLGLPAGWLGSNFEVHDLPAGDGRAPVVRRPLARRPVPAVLWESAVELTAPVLAPVWSSAESSGAARRCGPHRSRR